MDKLLCITSVGEPGTLWDSPMLNLHCAEFASIIIKAQFYYAIVILLSLGVSVE